MSFAYVYSIALFQESQIMDGFLAWGSSRGSHPSPSQLSSRRQQHCGALTAKPRHMPGALLLALVASQAGNTNTSCTLPSAQLPWAYVTPGCSAGKDIPGGPDTSGPQSSGCKVACVAGYEQGTSGTYDVGCSCAQHSCEIVMPTPHCVACPAGTWSDKPGVPKCTACPGAPATTTASPGASAITDCLCDQGYTGQIKSPSDECTACPAGSYKGEVGPSPKICKPCPDPGATTTLVIAPTAITDCVCDKGYVGYISGKPGDACKPCDAGTYKSVAGDQQCTPCPALSTTDSATTCKDIKACRCIPGYSGTINSPADMCTACAHGQYRGDSHAGGSGGNSGADTCQTCPGGATTAALGSTSLNDCLCPAGTSGVIAADMPTRCQPCAKGSYKEKPGPSACTPCPAETDTDGTGTDDGAECLQALSPTDTIIISAALSATLLGVCVRQSIPIPSQSSPPLFAVSHSKMMMMMMATMIPRCRCVWRVSAQVRRLPHLQRRCTQPAAGPVATRCPARFGSGAVKRPPSPTPARRRGGGGGRPRRRRWRHALPPLRARSRGGTDGVAAVAARIDRGGAWCGRGAHPGPAGGGGAEGADAHTPAAPPRRRLSWRLSWRRRRRRPLVMGMSSRDTTQQQCAAPPPPI
eukprot:COSAG01_NODE_4639_length_4859_cov_2.261765_1_plen_640_part_00